MTFIGKLMGSAWFLCGRAMVVGMGLSLTLGAAAQSGKPEPMAPLKEHDARVGALLDVLGKVRTPTMAALSPDGTYVAWTVRGSGASELHITGLAAEGSAQDGAWERVISPDTIGNVTNSKGGLCSGSSPVWSPDGKKLAFLSGCKDADGHWQSSQQDELFVWTLADNGMTQLTHVTGNVDEPAWSPDGKAIAFLVVENATRTAGALAAMKPWSGVVGEDGVEVQRVAVATVADAETKQVSPSNRHVYEFTWAPDSKHIAYVAAEPPGENNWWVAELWTQDLTPLGAIHGTLPKTLHMILSPSTVSGSLHGLQIAVPRYSPDGKQIAFIGGLMSDQGSTGGDLYVMPSAGLSPSLSSEPKDVTPNRAASIVNFDWISDTQVRLAEHVGGDSHITLYDLTTNSDVPGALNVTYPESIGSGGLLMSLSTSTRGHGEVALIRSSFERAPEVWTGPLTNLRQITHLNEGLKPLWGKTENVEWENEGFKVQGWLLYPANYDPAKKYPLVVSVHGGPSSAVSPRWPAAGYGAVPFSALGYFVFMPNPRGSYGQGEKFTQANVKDFGYGDLRDILAGMDALEKRFPIDKNREGLTGWSYGGFMTMFGVTQTTRFRAAVAGAGISDWKSYYGENSIDQWMVPFFGATVYDDPVVYAKSSAIEYIKKVKTPTLVVVGDRDGECPAPQSFEFWHALKAEGVKTQLVVYPNEGHSFRDPGHRLDVMERALAWFEAEMPESKN
jgi:dipeptidyl aminopeptidase/acylaminoacyl peptidase